MMLINYLYKYSGFHSYQSLTRPLPDHAGIHSYHAGIHSYQPPIPLISDNSLYSSVRDTSIISKGISI